MTAHLDLITLTLHWDATVEELTHLYAILGCPEQHDERVSELVTALMHEQTHLLSFLASELADVHRMILEVMRGEAQQVILAMTQSHLTERLSVPLVERHGLLFPNALSAYAKLKVDVATILRRSMEDLNQFLVGYAPRRDGAHLLTAYQQFLTLSNLVQPQEAGLLCTPVIPVDSLIDAEGAICFMREHHRASIIPQICEPSGSPIAALPILPRIRAHTVPGSDAPMRLYSRSVLEALAVIGELLGMRDRFPPPRPALPVAYRSALIYCLDCINLVSGERYRLVDLLAGRIPDWVYVTTASMLDLALQIEAPESPIHRHAVLIEKCPAWRLLLIGACVKDGHAPLIAPGPHANCDDAHAWPRQVCSRMGWRPPSRRATLEVQACRSRHNAPLTGDALFNHLRDVAAAEREHHRLGYLSGQRRLLEGEWFDFTAWESRDRQQIFTTDHHLNARREFIAAQDLQHYGLSALVFGVHWDRWWGHQGIRHPSEHNGNIAKTLNRAIALSSQRRSLPGGARPAFLAHDIIVREEFSEIPGAERVARSESFTPACQTT